MNQTLNLDPEKVKVDLIDKRLRWKEPKSNFVEYFKKQFQAKTFNLNELGIDVIRK